MNIKWTSYKTLDTIGKMQGEFRAIVLDTNSSSYRNSGFECEVIFTDIDDFLYHLESRSRIEEKRF